MISVNCFTNFSKLQHLSKKYFKGSFQPSLSSNCTSWVLICGLCVLCRTKSTKISSWNQLCVHSLFLFVCICYSTYAIDGWLSRQSEDQFSSTGYNVWKNPLHIQGIMNLSLSSFLSLFSVCPQASLHKPRLPDDASILYLFNSLCLIK